ncbi:myophilin isoform X1 [Hydra vulgaris]|uniref:myophilin isoform X1 n=1 Tax=Hydra vulgaris TaxID=6087 RepID=UPI0002B4D5B3|nr:myophilin [Hydra vulgaris]
MASSAPEKDNTLEVKSAIAKKYDSVVEKNVLTWISGVLKNPDLFNGVSGADALQEKLKSGVILCNLMNAIKPGCIKKFNSNAKMPFQQMENIGLFNEAMRNYGVQSDYLFVTTDLFEGKNMVQVLIGLRALGSKASSVGIKPAIVEN